MSTQSPPKGATRTCVARTHEVPPDGRKQVMVGDRAIAIFNVAGEYFAVPAQCPHRGGPLVRGRLEGYTLQCPLHGWAFDLRTGDSHGRPRNLEVLPSWCEGDCLFVAL